MVDDYLEPEQTLFQGLKSELALRKATLEYHVIMGKMEEVIKQAQSFSDRQTMIHNTYKGALSLHIESFDTLKAYFVEQRNNSGLEDAILDFMQAMGRPRKLIIQGDYESIVAKLTEKGFGASSVYNPGKDIALYYQYEGPVGDCGG